MASLHAFLFFPLLCFFILTENYAGARAKLRKQSLSHTDQPANSETISSDSPNISQIPIQIRHSPNNSLPGVSNFGLSACWGQNIHLPDAYSNNAARLDLFTSAPELLSQSQTLESSQETNIQLHQPQMPRSIWNDRLEVRGLVYGLACC